MRSMNHVLRNFIGKFVFVYLMIYQFIATSNLHILIIFDKYYSMMLSFMIILIDAPLAMI
jgi:hypothetical protein